jgi:hypothetical protein
MTLLKVVNSFSCILLIVNKQVLLWLWAWWLGFSSQQEWEFSHRHDGHASSGTVPVTDAMNRPTGCFIGV